jgi:predicted site-specific integrase-resolvase
MVRIGIAARELSIAPSTMRRWLEKGYVSGVRTPSGRWLVQPDSVREVLAADRPVAKN